MPRLPSLLLSAACAGALVALSRRWGLWSAHTLRHVPAVPPPPPLDEDPPGRPPSQRLHDGYGPVFHRVYRLDFAEPAWTPEQLMADLQRRPNAYCPRELAWFEPQLRQSQGGLSIGDEFVVHIRGPWNGPVRVIERAEGTLSFVTLEGHMEAGQIRFAVGPAPAEVRERYPSALRFKVESWARSRDEAVDLAYHRLRLAMLAQQAVWAYMCRQVARRAGGRALGRVAILTEEAPYDTDALCSYAEDA